ncbi:DUF3800 domain-containing protein [Nocardia sp. N13]|uniref:DUF3800 domain-containing protein n=1 Tax=Nocardioides sp. N13(2025) TaxID=3453405 RepID=UPI003F76E9B7
MDTVIISCDESGSEGENVAEARHRVFCHGSVDLTLDEATNLMAEIRGRLQSKSVEIKSSAIVKNEPLLRELFGSDGRLKGRAMMVLFDKQYFVVSKVIDLLVEELAYENGVHLHLNLRARDLARNLFIDGPRAYDADAWAGLMEAFVSLTRLNQRKGAKATVEEFFILVDALRLSSRRKRVAEVMQMVHNARLHASDFQSQLQTPDPSAPPTMDPLFAAVTATAFEWADRGSRRLHLLHDEQAALTPLRLETMKHYIVNPLPEFATRRSRITHLDIELKDSRTDPRIQVADLVAGVGRAYAEPLLNETKSIGCVDMPQFVGRLSVWAHEPSWKVLTGQPLAR